MSKNTPGSPQDELSLVDDGSRQTINEPAVGAPTETPPTLEALVQLAERLGKARDLRSDYLASELFAEPAWDMLLALFQADAAGRRTTVSNLCTESGAPPSTALRWIDKLEELKLVRRAKNPLDARVVFVELEHKGRLALHQWLCHIWTVFYAIG